MASRDPDGAVDALRQHWREYLIEAWGLGTFMVAAGAVATALEYPGSPLRQALPDPVVRRFLMGLAMGLTAVGLVYCPWGKRSGAHYNPAFTLTFLRLGKIARWDAAFYIAAQFAGGLAGVVLVRLVVGAAFADPRVDYVVTVPGTSGVAPAFMAELVISFVLMLAVLVFINEKRLNRFTGLVVGALLVLYITVEAPYSGMSLNPARTVASALPAHLWRGVWVYFTAPLVGMLAAARVHRMAPVTGPPLCAKLHHESDHPCIFRCDYARYVAAQTREP